MNPTPPNPPPPDGDAALEARLRRLAPAPLDPLWQRHLALLLREEARATARRRPAELLRLWWPAAAAALLLIGLTAWGWLLPVPAPAGDAGPVVQPAPDTAPALPQAATTPPAIADGAAAASLEPVLAENRVLNATDEGIVELADGARARQFRYEMVDLFRWRDPRTGAQMEMHVPREETVYVRIDAN